MLPGLRENKTNIREHFCVRQRLNNFEMIGESLAEIFKYNITENLEYVLRIYTILILVFMFGYLHEDWSRCFIRYNNIEVFSMVMSSWKHVLQICGQNLAIFNGKVRNYIFSYNSQINIVSLVFKLRKHNFFSLREFSLKLNFQCAVKSNIVI